MMDGRVGPGREGLGENDLLAEVAAEYAALRIDACGRITRWGRGAERVTGVARASALGRALGAVLTFEAGEGVAAAIAALRAGRRYRADAWCRRASDEQVDLRVTFASSGASFAVVLHDVTGCRAADDGAWQHEMLFEYGQALSQTGTWSTSFSPGAEVVWSRETYRIFGVEPGTSMTSNDVMALIHPDDRSAVTVAALATVNKGEGFDVVHRVVRPDGDERWVHERGALVRGPDGVDSLIGCVREVTEQFRMQDALRRAGANFRHLLDGSSDPAVVSRDETVVYVNAALVSLLGYTFARELVGRSVFDLVPADEHEAAREHVTRAHATPWAHHAQRADGAVVEVESARMPIFFEGGPALLALVRDVRALREAERARQRLAAIVEGSYDAIIGTSADGVIEDWNPAAERLFGYTAAEAVGQHITMLVCPDRPDAPTLYERVTAGEPVLDVQTVRRHRDGHTLNVAITVSPIADASGRVTRMSAFLRDTTELLAMQARLAVADRLSTMGTLVAGVAHEVNNPLSYVLYNLDAVDERLAALSRHVPTHVLDDLRGALGDARHGATRVRSIVRDLTAFSRGDGEVGETTDVRRVVDSTAKMAQPQIGRRARLVTSYGQTPPVAAGEGRLHQVVLNLLVNAAHAIPEGADAGRHVIRVTTSTDARGRAVIEVSDTGAGIPIEAQPRVFDPFFTTKPVGVGTGLGLSICHSIVTGLGGDIAFTSVPGKGTTFRVLLPPARPALGVSEASAIARRGSVLVIDDEPRLVGAMRSVLSNEHAVSSVTSAREALDRIQKGERFDAIVCDLMMPGMSGMDLFDELAHISPSLPGRIVYVTGGAFTQAAQNFLRRIPNPRLSKPFHADELRGALRTIMHPVAC